MSVNKDDLRERVDAAMEGGERERIKQALRSKVVRKKNFFNALVLWHLCARNSKVVSFLEQLVQSGWRDEIKSFVGELIETRGVDNVTAEELIEEVTPYAKASERAVERMLF